MKLKLLALILPVIVLSSCQKEPTAAFTADKNEVFTNQIVNFTNSSLYGRSYMWEFGDGTTSIAENPSKAYNTPGTYVVKLTVWSRERKKSAETTANIVVKEPEPDYAPNYVGVFDVMDDFSTQSCGSDVWFYSIEISAIGKNKIEIDNFHDLADNVTATVDENGFVLDANTIDDKFGAKWNILSGSGTYLNDTLTMHYKVTDAPFLNVCGEVEGDVEGEIN